jgi:hypothetical protein
MEGAPPEVVVHGSSVHSRSQRDPVAPLGTTVPSKFSEDAGRAFIASNQAWLAWVTGLSQVVGEKD